MSFREVLSNEFPLTGRQLELLEHHYELLKKWNRKLNLTRIEDPQSSLRLNYAESLIVAQSLPGGPLSIADVGSGPGFPGVPIAIARPECSISLVESHQRKAVFLRECSREIANIEVVADRIENLSRSFDWIVSRAVLPNMILSLRHSKNFAILMSERDLPGLPGLKSMLKLPWGNERVLAMFHVEHARIDETSG